MDDLVVQAMAKWPNVPSCVGWLGLDARGDWYMRDANAQAQGPFAGAGSSTASKGSRLQHTALIGFIQRNYAVDDNGCWYFQNGPQRVFVELEAAPWILRVQQQSDGFTVVTHTGQPFVVQQAFCDEQGRVFLQGDLGLGLVHSLDMLDCASALEQEVWPLQSITFASLPAQWGYVLSPQQRNG